MYNTPVYLVSPICQCRALMSKGCIHKALVEMSLCPSMTQDREGCLHECLKEVSVPTCSLLVTKMSRNGLGGWGGAPAPQRGRPVSGERVSGCMWGFCPWAHSCQSLSRCLFLTSHMLYLADTGLLWLCFHSHLYCWNPVKGNGVFIDPHLF